MRLRRSRTADVVCLFVNAPAPRTRKMPMRALLPSAGRLALASALDPHRLPSGVVWSDDRGRRAGASPRRGQPAEVPDRKTTATRFPLPPPLKRRRRCRLLTSPASALAARAYNQALRPGVPAAVLRSSTATGYPPWTPDPDTLAQGKCPAPASPARCRSAQAPSAFDVDANGSLVVDTDRSWAGLGRWQTTFRRRVGLREHDGPLAITRRPPGPRLRIAAAVTAVYSFTG